MKNNTLIIIAIILAMLLILVGTILTTSVKTKKVKVKCYDNHNNEIKGATCIKEVPLNNHICVVFNRSEEHTSELQSHSFISYAVFCLKKKKIKIKKINEK